MHDRFALYRTAPLFYAFGMIKARIPFLWHRRLRTFA
jgi:hypothetical protein